jgi:hypothetical protein
LDEVKQAGHAGLANTMMFDGRADRLEIEPEPDEDSDEGRLRYGG